MANNNNEEYLKDIMNLEEFYSIEDYSTYLMAKTDIDMKTSRNSSNIRLMFQNDINNSIEIIVKKSKIETIFEHIKIYEPSKKNYINVYVRKEGQSEYDGKEILIDPVTKLGDKIIDYSGLPKADYIIVTHEHGDHFDKEAIATLTNDKTQFITNARCAGMIGYGKVMKNGDQLQVDDIHVEAVPAYNITEGHQQFHPKGRDNGYVLTIDGLRIYIAGDTEDIPEMASLKDIDIAFLPCNQPYTMTTDQLQRAARVFKPRVLFPYHYSQTDLRPAVEQLQKEGMDVRVRHYE